MSDDPGACWAQEVEDLVRINRQLVKRLRAAEEQAAEFKAQRDAALCAREDLAQAREACQLALGHLAVMSLAMFHAEDFAAWKARRDVVVAALRAVVEPKEGT